MSEKSERIQAIQQLLASIFASQKALKILAPEFNWAGLGNLLGDFGELIAIDHYGLTKANGGSDGYDALRADGKSVQIKTVYAANQIGFRGNADYLLVLVVKSDGSWEELFYDEFSRVQSFATYSKRDNKNVITLPKLRRKL